MTKRLLKSLLFSMWIIKLLLHCFFQRRWEAELKFVHIARKKAKWCNTREIVIMRFLSLFHETWAVERKGILLEHVRKMLRAVFWLELYCTQSKQAHYEFCPVFVVSKFPSWCEIGVSSYKGYVRF